MKISIITVCRNSEKTIRTTIESVLGQDYGGIEYIIVDGGSIDSTVSLIREYAPDFGGRLRWISEPDGGIYDALNKGIAMATGEVIGIINSDDAYYDHSVVSRVAAEFDEECDAVYGDLIFVDKRRFSRVKRYWKSGHYDSRSFLHGWMPPHPTVFVRREIYGIYGAFRTDFKNSSDYEFILRVFYKMQIRTRYIPRVLVKMRMGGVSNKNLYNRLLANSEDKKAWLINRLRPRWYTFLLKPLHKLPQFFRNYRP